MGICKYCFSNHCLKSSQNKIGPIAIQSWSHLLVCILELEILNKHKHFFAILSNMIQKIVNKVNQQQAFCSKFEAAKNYINEKILYKVVSMVDVHLLFLLLFSVFTFVLFHAAFIHKRFKYFYSTFLRHFCQIIFCSVPTNKCTTFLKHFEKQIFYSFLENPLILFCTKSSSHFCSKFRNLLWLMFVFWGEATRSFFWKILFCLKIESEIIFTFNTIL